ncbi:MAG: M1 family metallopeptidase [Bacteroidetes bacterium]|nr:M1 family metallopeptidase [Bacteroidota bacterium]
MSKIISLIVLCFFCFSITKGQQLYEPRSVMNAYKKETRSRDGQPGPKYWQNHGIYDIQVTAIPPNRNIKGTEEITYINNSPDTINNPVIKLILNIHKPGAIRETDASPDYLTSGVHIDKISSDGINIKWKDPEYHDTWQSIHLPKPLYPKDSVQLHIEWNYNISLKSGREGMIDSTTYYLAYFYPRVAVFDDIDGWDRMNFTDFQEFYNDFNDYTLKVTVPKNYIVWSTGTLQNPNAVLQPTYVDKLNASMKTDEVMHIATPADLASKNVTAQNNVNTWQWAASNITDMACAISDHYVWDASSVVVDDATQRRASVQSAYNDTAKDFHQMVEFGRHALSWLSKNWPGVPYPFPKTTIVQGYADMEYPMMVNDGTNEDPLFSRFVVEHEIAHSWFPFYMGINETRYGFMDEGWATTFELLIGREDLGKERAENFYKQFRVNGWIKDASAEEDVPIITPGSMLTGRGLGNNEYGKPSLGYLAMKDLLGDPMFKKCLQEYMYRWHGKHPIPWDFFYTFNDASGENLNWFWNNWFFSNYYIDLAIEKVSKTTSGYAITIKNIGGYAAPVDLQLHYSDGSSDTLHQTPRLWEKNQKRAVVDIKSKKKITSIELDGGIFMDADETNNVWKP